MDAKISVAQDAQRCDLSSRKGEVLIPGTSGEGVIEKVEWQNPAGTPEGIVKQGHDVALAPL